jgi:DNA-binding transcriptional ArsR family regulator
MLRKSLLLDVLLGKTKQEILTATLLRPERSWYLLELARHLRLRPSSLQRELKQLTEAGILRRQEDGNRVYFQADTNCPVFQELAQILFKTAGVIEALRNALEPLQNEIDIAFVYGSVATSSERSTSDIDLMVIGSVPLSKIAPLIRDLERRVGRAINPTVYGQAEFKRRFQSESHFLKSVLRQKPLFIKGGPGDLGKLAASTESQATPHKQARTRRLAQRR